MNIAIVGATASGKSWLLQELKAQRPDLLLTDAPPLLRALQTAPPQDHSTWQQLAALHRQDYELTLLTGLDLPGSTRQQEKEDALLRETLQQGGVVYGVVYGSGPDRLRNALRLISPEAERPARWRGQCENCADPGCEHRLFTELKDLKAAAHRPA